MANNYFNALSSSLFDEVKVIGLSVFL